MYSKSLTSLVVSTVLTASVPALATVINSSGDPLLTGATTITFSEVSLGIYNPLVIGGVTFDAFGENNLRVENNPCLLNCTPVTGPVLANQVSDTASTSGVNFDIIFGTAVTAVGFDAAALNSDVVLTAYDSSDSFLGSTTLSSISPNFYFQFAGLAFSDIKRLNVSTTDYIVVDNVKYTNNESVPEPATFLLLSLGLGSLVLSRRKLKQQ